MANGFLVTGTTWASTFLTGSGTTAYLLYTDITSGPITGGENNLGCYLSVYGTNLGTLADWTSGTNKLFIGGVQVSGYCSLKPAVGAGSGGPGNGVYETWGIKCLRVQVGALGSPTLGVALPITATFGGDPAGNSTSGGSLLDFDGVALTFTPCAGSIVFVSLTGNDVNTGTIASPKRHLQTAGSSFGGAIYGPNGINAMDTSAAIMVQPGTHVILRGGDYSADTSFLTSWCDFFGRTGLLGKELVVTSYPGAVGSDAPEAVIYNCQDLRGGGLNWGDSARSQQATVYGTTGYHKYIVISNMKISGPTGHFSSSGAAGAPINLQVHAEGAGIINCDLSFPTTGYADGVVASDHGPTAAGIAGHGTLCRRIGNWVHDVYDPSGALQNHGFYIGEFLQGSVVAARGEIHTRNAFNCFNRIHGGQAIMARGAYQTETAPYCSFHHNWCQRYGKHGIEFFDERAFARAWNNVIVGEVFTAPGTTGSQSGFYVGSDNVSATNGIWIANNTIIGPFTVYAGLTTVASNGGGTLRFQNNVVVQDTGGIAAFSSSFYLSSSIVVTLDKNIWYDVRGSETTKPSGDTLGSYVNPLFVDMAGHDYTPQASSPLKNASTTAVITVDDKDFFIRTRPQGSATNFSIGAIERSGG